MGDQGRHIRCWRIQDGLALDGMRGRLYYYLLGQRIDIACGGTSKQIWTPGAKVKIAVAILILTP